MSSIERLFTYGTLRMGADNAMQKFLTDRAGWLGQATFQGNLYYCNGHPAVLPSENNEDKVIGDLFEAGKLHEIFKTLDRYEGFDPANKAESLYLRKQKTVTLQSSKKKQALEAWIYLYNKPIDKARKIRSGDYLKYSETNLG